MMRMRDETRTGCEQEAVQALEDRDYRGEGQMPIAIIGIGCRFPQARGPEAFWQLMRDGIDTIGEIPKERFDVDALFDPRRRIHGRMYTRSGGFIDAIERFDASFFGISPREAAAMDPQQRILLEVAWEAVEDAGLLRSQLDGSRTGVFVGMWINDYDDLLFHKPERLDLYAIIGGGRSLASGRVSHFLGLEGPSLTIDTACSSSLSAVHLACQSLVTGESEMALAAGANLVIHPGPSLSFCGAGMLSNDGRCKFADKSADGFGRSDGVGVLVLKPLERAEADGDPIYAVIRGSAANNNGKKSGQISVPNDLQQAEAVRLACSRAGFPPAALNYVEAHGTGTPVGDPIELACLGSVLSEGGRADDDPCLVGSVKTNIGHTEGAAGIAGLIKLALSLERDEIPPSLIFTELNPDIPWDEIPLEVVQEARPWPRNGGPGRAGVSATGLSGANAHIVVEGAPERSLRKVEESAERARLLLLSGHSPEVLKAQAESYVERLALPFTTDESLADFCSTTQVRRNHHAHRLAIAGHNPDELSDALRGFLAGETRRTSSQGHTGQGEGNEHSTDLLTFVFSGQGSQWIGMGRELLAEESVFREAIERCARALTPLLGWSVLERLEEGRPEGLGETDIRQEILQPMVFSMQVALAALWRSWGIEPEAVVGHSMGEVAAAHVAGALELEEAALIISKRSSLLMQRAGQGAMALVELPLAEAEEVLVGYEDKLSAAISNSATSTVLAGFPEALEEVVALLEERGVYCRRVKIDFAAHSPQMDALLPELTEHLEGLEPQATKVPFFSAIEPGFKKGEELGATYWAGNLRQSVLFANALARLIDEGHTQFLEISPHPILRGAIQEALELAEVEGLALPSLRRTEAERVTLLTSLGAFFTRGREANWPELAAEDFRPASLPLYAFQGESFWLGDLDGLDSSSLILPSGPGHPLLSTASASAANPAERFWQLELGAESSAWLQEHRIQEEVLVPGAAFLEMALSAAAESLGGEYNHLVDVRFEKALTLREVSPEAQLVVDTSSLPEEVSFRFFSRSGGEGQEDWTLNAEGSIGRGGAGAGEVGETFPERLGAPRELLARFPETLSGQELYRSLKRRGYGYGPEFQGLAEVWWNGSESLSRLKDPDAMGWSGGGYRVHPSLLDAAIQTLLIGPQTTGLYVPIQIESLRVLKKPAECAELWCHTLLRTAPGRQELTGDFFLLDGNGAVVLEALGVKVFALDRSAVVASAPEEWLYDIRWREQAAAPEADEAGAWLLLADERGVGSRLQSLLETQGAQCFEARIASGSQTPAQGAFAVDPADPASFERCFGELAARGVALRGIVHLWSLDVREDDNASASTLWEGQDLGVLSTLSMVQALAASGTAEPPGLWLVTAGSQSVEGEDVAVTQAPLWGLGRVVSNEQPQLWPRRIDLSQEPSEAELTALGTELLSYNGADEVALRGEKRYEPALIRFELKAPEGPGIGQPVEAEKVSCRLEQPSPGVLDELVMRPIPRRAPGPGEVEIRVASAGLNFRNVLVALGQVPGEADDLGLECVGTLTAVGEGVEGLAVGDEVMAMTPAAFATYVVARASSVCRKPERLSFEEAATLTIAFTTAYYSLFDLGRLEAGERVLIHAATGGVGLAAVQLAQSVGAEIFATAGSEEKHAHLRALGVKHILSSRSMDFAEQILELTDGEGVDMVLNSLAHEGIPKGLSTLRPYGRFLELGKVDFFENSKLGLSPFLKNLSFFGVDLNHMMRERPERFQRLLIDTMNYFEAKSLEPLPIKTFKISEVAEAFRFMARAQHIGKIVVQLEGEKLELDPVVRSVELRPEATYLVTGGLGGVGLALAEWMVEQGARHLVLVGRSGASEQGHAKLEQLAAAGAEVLVERVDVTDRQALEKLFARFDGELPPLAGVVHGAMVLDDGILEQLNRERFRDVMAPKMLGAWYLHLLTREIPLDFFALFSSVTTLFGSPGQGNYVAANTFLDALAHFRQARGLPGLSICWGAWAEVGVAAAEAGDRLALRGIESFRTVDGLELFGKLLTQDAAQVAVMPMSWQRFKESNATAERSTLFADLLAEKAGDSVQAPDRFLSELLAAPAESWAAMLEQFVIATVARVMGFAVETVELHKPLNQLGLDSLMAVELRNRIERELEITLAVPLLLGGSSSAQLATELLERLEAGELLSQLGELSDDAVGELLNQMLAKEEL